MVSLAVPAVVVVVLIVIRWYRSRLKKFSILKDHGIPGPEPTFVQGNFNIATNRSTVELHTQWLKEYGDIFGTYTGTMPTVVVKDPELLKLIQIKDFHLFSSRRKLGIGNIDAHSRSNDMLITQDGERWKQVRSILTPTFNASKMKRSVGLINDAIEAFLENVQSKSAGGDEEFDVYELFQGLTMDTIGRSAFGTQTNVQRNPNDPFLLAAKRVFSGFRGSMWRNMLFIVNVWFPEFTFILYPMRWIQFRILDALNLTHQRLLYDVCQRIVDERRQNTHENNGKSKNDLLQTMIEAKMTGDQMAKTNLTADVHTSELASGQVVTETSTDARPSKKVHYMTESEIVANAVLFFEAGYETTSTALGFMAHVLVNNQDIQDRIREEILNLVEREGDLNYNTVTELTYMEAVLFETLRVYPPITTFVTRLASVDYHYKDMVIPKGAGVVVPVYQLHRDPNLWPEPEKFDPSRFMSGKVNPIAWQPFGAGPRNCIGLRFALLEAKLALARLLQLYKLVPGPSTELGDIDIEYKVIGMTPKKGVFVRAVPL